MQQLFRLLIFLISLTRFGRQIRPSSGALFDYIQHLVQCTDTAADWSVGSSVSALYQKLYIQSKSAPEDGRICRPKHVGLIKKINK